MPTRASDPTSGAVYKVADCGVYVALRVSPNQLSLLQGFLHMGNKRKGHYLTSFHVDFDDEFNIVGQSNARVATTRQEDEDRRAAQRRKEIEGVWLSLLGVGTFSQLYTAIALRNDMQNKISQNSALIDAPGGLDYSDDFAMDCDLYDWAEEQLKQDESENIVVIDDVYDAEYEGHANIADVEFAAIDEAYVLEK